jgi:hypothetical protein
VQCSDVNVQELNYHLTKTHLVSEIILVATRRFLEKEPAHPLFQLLNPHVNKLLPLNDAARSNSLDSLKVIVGTNAAGIRKLIKLSFEEYYFSKASPVADLKCLLKITSLFFHNSILTLLWTSFSRGGGSTVPR